MIRIKKILMLLMCVVFMLSFCVTAFADDSVIDFSKEGSITIMLKDNTGEHGAVKGATFKLYKVADVISAQSTLGYEFTSDFESSGVFLNDLRAEGLAEHLATYAKQEDLSAASGTTDSDGKLKFNSLELGLYLVVQSGSTDDFYANEPFLVSVPMTNDEGTGWIYDVDVSPKVQAKPYDPIVDGKNITVKKVWSGSGADKPTKVNIALLRDGDIYERIELNSSNSWKYEWKDLDENYRWSISEINVPDGYQASYSSSGAVITITNTYVPDIPDNPESLTVKKVWDAASDPNRPTSVTVELWNGGVLYSSVTLSAENGWVKTWRLLPKSDKWSIREVNIPERYEVSYSVVGTEITIKNTYVPDVPDNPVKPPLIQTGQLNWPVPVFAGAGLMFVFIGWGLILSKRKKDDKE